MQRLRNLRSISISNSASAANLKRKSLNSWAAIQETYLSTKVRSFILPSSSSSLSSFFLSHHFLLQGTFERHRVVFTVGTSIASVATAFLGLFSHSSHQYNLISLLYTYFCIFNLIYFLNFRVFVASCT